MRLFLPSRVESSRVESNQVESDQVKSSRVALAQQRRPPPNAGQPHVALRPQVASMADTCGHVGGRCWIVRVARCSTVVRRWVVPLLVERGPSQGEKPRQWCRPLMVRGSTLFTRSEYRSFVRSIVFVVFDRSSNRTCASSDETAARITSKHVQLDGALTQSDCRPYRLQVVIQRQCTVHPRGPVSTAHALR